ncbi:eCIS core domain-containing protein [Novosphingobium lentum]|uniref:eCIS core domain-containing protein n=1 Tax=Novosphingobium lentum TaxID=145287 RepID=UPI00082EE69A|nr:DUF4157 domain-containing protein [Novosphingobium lentum]
MGCSSCTTLSPDRGRQGAVTPDASDVRRRAATPNAAGNQAHLRRLAVGGQPLQAKLTIGAVNDPLEHEADAAADRVMRMADPGATLSSGPGALQRKCAACEDEEPIVRRRAAGADVAGEAAPQAVHDVLNMSGSALDPATHDFMASRFGTDFSDVRIHTDAQAAQSAADVGARAYTVGSNVVFGAGQYDPAGEGGRHLLAHELAHVVQQSAGTMGVQRDLATPPPAVAPAAQTDLTPAQIQEAIRFNTGFYDDANTRLIQSILGGGVTGRWTADNITAIAATQEEYGLKKDGKIGPDTFDFITREQTAENLPTDTANCLTAFRVIPFPVLSDTTPGPNGRTRIQGHHKIEARFSSRCDCSQFEYRQFIAGVATGSRGGAIQDLSAQFGHIPGGALPVAMTEDGNTTCAARNYGHRNQPGLAADTVQCGENHYTDGDGTENQASGCVYRGEDHPQLIVNGLQTGDTTDLLVQFRGEIRRAGTVIETKTWTDIDTSVVTP